MAAVAHRTRMGRALLAVQPEHARRGGRGDLDPALERDLAVDDALVEEVQHCLVSALGPIRRAVKSRDVMSTFEALSAVAKAQGQVTKAIERHTADPRTMPMDDDVMALLSQGNMPVEKTEA